MVRRSEADPAGRAGPHDRLGTGQAPGGLNPCAHSSFQIFDDDPKALVVEKLRSGLTNLTEREADVVGHWLGFDLSHSAAVADLAGSAGFDSVAMAHLRRHLGVLAGARPVVMLLEDVHWADDESLDAVLHLVGQLEAAPVLVVCLARPTFAERRPIWTASPGSPNVVELTALSTDDAARLVQDILQRADHVPRGLVEMIVEQADGNPFYIEELVKMLLDDGVIVAAADGPWSVEDERLERLTVPPTLTGVLQARLDGLADDERVALQHAAVVGRVFWDDAVASLVSDTIAEPVSQESMTPILGAVRAKELVRYNERSTFSGSVELKFKHALLREVTYETVLLDDRRRLHGVAASWLRNRAEARLSEHLGPLAEHLFNAGEHLLAAETIEHAARNAAATGAVATTISLYRRALGLRGDVGADHTVEAARARVALVELLQRAGESASAAEQLAVAATDAETLGDVRLLAFVRVLLGGLAVDRGERELAGELLERARPEAEAIGGQVLAELLLTRGWLEHMNNHVAACVATSEQALKCSRALADGEREVRALHTMSIGNLRLGCFDEAEEQLRDALAIADRIGNTAREAMLLNDLGALIHTQAGGEHGAMAKAIDLYQQSMRLYEVLGATAGTIAVLGNLSQAEVEAGRLDDGARHAHEFLSKARERGLTIDMSFAILIHAELAIVSGDVANGLRLIGVATADPRGDHRGDEVERILRLHGISAEEADAGMEAGRVLAIDTIVDKLLAEGPGEPEAARARRRAPAPTSGTSARDRR